MHANLLKIDKGNIIIGDKLIPQYRYIEELGRGANGIVLKVENSILGRIEAMKVWLTLRKGDKRDKLKQGIAEIQKLVAVSPASSWVVNVYSANVIGSTLISHLEYIPGETLHSILQRNPSDIERYNMAALYLNALLATSEHALHGDPHAKNIMLYEHAKSNHNSKTYIKLLDFGTSLFTHPNASISRHWQIVDQTFDNILGPLELYKMLRNPDERPKMLERQVPGAPTDAEYLSWEEKFSRVYPLAFYKDIVNGIHDMMLYKSSVHSSEE